MFQVDGSGVYVCQYNHVQFSKSLYELSHLKVLFFPKSSVANILSPKHCDNYFCLKISRVYSPDFSALLMAWIWIES